MAKQPSFIQELDALRSVLEALDPLEADKRAFVLNTAVERLGISNVALSGKSSDSGSTVDNGGSPVGIRTPVDQNRSAKDFLKAKRPATDVQRIACLAYYLSNNRNTPHFKTRDLTDLNTEAAGDRFANAAQAVKNATNQNHYLSPAGKGRKQITTLGEDVVNALPDQEKVKAAIAAGTAGRRKKRKSSKAKKS